MALVGTPLQKSMRIHDTPEIALADWLRFGELDESDEWPLAWARYYVENSVSEVHDWLKTEGIKFMPAVNWVERGRFGDGRSEEHTSELQSLMRISYAVFCLKKKITTATTNAQIYKSNISFHLPTYITYTQHLYTYYTIYFNTI